MRCIAKIVLSGRKLVPAFIKLEISDRELLSNQAKILDRMWRDNVQFINEECNGRYCKLLPEAILKTL